MTHRTHPRLHPLGLVLALFLLLLAVAACGGTLQTDVTLYSSGSWDASSLLEMPGSALSLSGGRDQLEQSFAQMVSEEASKGVQVSVKEAKASSQDLIAYRLTMKGTDFATLEEIGLNAQPTDYDGQKAWAISYSPTDNLGGMEQTIRVHVGKILANDGLQEDAGTIVGGTSQYISAVIVPKSPFNPLFIIVPILAGALVAGVVLAVVLRKKGSTGQSAPAAQPALMAAPYVQQPQPAPGGALPCPNCGRATLPGSKFCMNCGAPVRPS